MKFSGLMRWGLLIWICIICTHIVYPKSTNVILNHADSLLYAGKFTEIIDYLLPLEYAFEEETDINKYHYYGLIGALYRRQNDYHKAIPYLEKQARYNISSIDDFVFLANLFACNKDYLNRNKAEYYARKALLMDNEANVFSYHKDYDIEQIGRSHYILGALAARSGNKDISEDHINWIKKNNSTFHSNLINHLQALIDSIPIQSSILMYDTIRPNAQKLIKESIIHNGISEISLKNLFKDDDMVYKENLDSVVFISDVAQYLRNVFYIEDSYGIEDINKSVPLIRKAMEISNRYDFHKAPSLELCELNMRLGRADYFLKRYDSAITWFLLSYNYSRKLKDGIFYKIQALGEIADIYLAKGEKYNAIIYADEMLENLVQLATNGRMNAEILIYLSRYASILFNTGYNHMAEEFYKIIFDYMPKHSRAYTLACNNYATNLFLNKNREEACYYYSLLKDAALAPQTISNLTISYLELNKLLEAEASFSEYYEQNLSLLEKILKGFTERVWENYWEKDGYLFYLTSNYLAHRIASEKSMITGYSACILSKEFPLEYKKYRNQIFASSLDSRIKTDYEKYINYQHGLSSSALTLPEKIQLVNTVDSLEQSLIKQIDFNGKLQCRLSDYKSVLNSLKRDEVAVEFCEYIDLIDNSQTPKYAAYIISPEYKCPVFVVFGDKIEISNKIFNSYKDELTINELYNNSDIYEIIWKPLMPYLNNKRKVYFSPVGELSLLNHQLLMTDKSRLESMFEMRRVSSTSILANRQKEENQGYKDMVLYGDINYNSTYEDIEKETVQCNNAADSAFLSQNKKDVREGWRLLQYARQEIDSIQSIIQKYDLSSIIYLGANANEKAFKSLDFNAPSIIHVATHGFSYFNNDEDEKRNKIKSLSPYTSESALMSWTGLLFAGANCDIKDIDCIDNFDDGLLTANEISHLHFDGVNLVVLSACKTGLGISDAFGLTTGLQKAFKLAGCQSILMSLWQVPDESTALLMTKFYEALLSGHNRHAALKIAMQKVREIYPDPYYWGAFVILD